MIVWVVAALAWTATTAGLPQDTVEPWDDAYHYAEFNDGRHDSNYVEWWYFNLYDEQQDLRAIFHYSIIDPDDLLGLGTASVGATLYTADGALTRTDSYGPEAFQASYDAADVAIDDGFVEVIDADTYRIVGAAGIAPRIEWDLVFVRRAPSWFAKDRQSVGVLSWEQMSWLVYMPRATVSGEVRVDDRVYRVEESPGYHDHNWGEWIPTTVLWNWAQYSEPGLALEIGDFRRSPAGVVSIERDGRRTVFEKDEYTLLHVGWEWDPENRRWYPLETWLFAGNDTVRLAVSLRTLETEPLELPVEIPFLLREPLLYEQTAAYLGAVWEKDAAGRFRLVATFRGNGFKEYTTRRLRR
jgi:hypothetical protein